MNTSLVAVGGDVTLVLSGTIVAAALELSGTSLATAVTLLLSADST